MAHGKNINAGRKRKKKSRSREGRSLKSPLSSDTSMQCSPKCPYFYMEEHIEWEYDAERGYKVRKNPQPFICDYDGHEIKNWNDECPYKRDKKLQFEGKQIQE